MCIINKFLQCNDAILNSTKHEHTLQKAVWLYDGIKNISRNNYKISMDHIQYMTLQTLHITYYFQCNCKKIVNVKKLQIVYLAIAKSVNNYKSLFFT